MNTEYTIETINHKGLTIKLVADNDAESPRGWENIGTMVCWHDKYNLGDKHDHSSPEDFFFSLAREFATKAEKAWIDRLDNIIYNSCGERAKRLQESLDKKINDILDREVVIMELYLYDHSGISMSCAPFSCPWDSGSVGYIYCTKEKAKRELSDSSDDAIREVLISEVKTYDAYLTGDVCGYVVNDGGGEFIDSCWGFFPDTNLSWSNRFDHVIDEAKSSADYWLEKNVELETQLCANI